MDRCMKNVENHCVKVIIPNFSSVVHHKVT